MARLNVVFDFGAVLFTWEPRKLLAQIFPQHADTDAKAAVLATEVFSHPDWHAFDSGRMTQADVTQLTHLRTGLDLPTLAHMIDSIGARLQPIESSVAVLADLHARRQAGADVGLFFLSNMPEPYARVLERSHVFMDWFDDGIFSGDVQLIKPDAAIFELATQRFGLQGDRTLFIDDLQSNIDASITHGWQGVHLPAPGALSGLLRAKIPL
jgi:putative hydrolase of the HAD superfamily